MSYLTTVITAYNRSDIIQNAINSSLREFPDQKIIVVDDASSDDLQKSLINQFFDEIVICQSSEIIKKSKKRYKLDKKLIKSSCKKIDSQEYFKDKIEIYKNV